MFKATVFCLAAVMLLSGVAIAQTNVLPGFKFQCEDFVIGSSNLLSLSGAGGQAYNLNTATIMQNQSDVKPCSNACQDELVCFIQEGRVIGECGGTWNIGQLAMVMGGQSQLVGDGCLPKQQSQNLGVDLGQLVSKQDGTGNANAIHNVAAIQNQTASNSAGTMNESNIVAAGQISTIGGGPVTSGQVTSGLLVNTTQTQVDL